MTMDPASVRHANKRQIRDDKRAREKTGRQSRVKQFPDAIPMRRVPRSLDLVLLISRTSCRTSRCAAFARRNLRHLPQR